MISSYSSDRDTIQRCPRDAEHPYAQILNDILRHKELSFEAIWLLSYLLSNSKNWKIKISQVILHAKGRAGKDKVYKMVKELMDFGYMERVPIRTEGSRFAGYQYFISETPKFKKCLPFPENTDTENELPENQDNKEEHVSLENTKVKEQQQKKKVANAPVVVSSSSKEQPPDEEAIKNAELAAKQYIEAQTKKGLPVNEKRIRKQALNERWVPNKTKEDIKAEKAQKEENRAKSSEKTKKEVEKIVEGVQHLFTERFYIYVRQSVVEIKLPNGVCPIGYGDEECIQILKDYIRPFLDGSG